MPDEIAELKTVTIEGVEMAATGYWQFSTGARWLTQEHLQAAVDAEDDPALKTPIIKIGHSDPRFDGSPLFGSIINLRLSDNKQKLLGDWVIAASLAPLVAKEEDQDGDVPYPDRSIEAWFDVKTSSGNEYAMVLTACALLGDKAPAIEGMDDIIGMWTDESEFVAAASEGSIEMGNKLLLAGTVVDKIRVGVWDEIPADDQPWGEWSWVRHLEIDSGSKGFVIVEDDDTSKLYQVPWEVSGDQITYGEPKEVLTQYVAASKQGSGNSMRFRRESDRVRGVPDTLSATEHATPTEGDVDLDKLRKKLGLAEDADEATIDAKLDELQKAETPKPDEGEEPETSETETEETSEEESTETEPAQVAADKDTVTLDKATWEQVQSQAKAGAQARERQRIEDRDRFLVESVKAGKFPPARKEHYAKLYDKDPEGTKTFIDELEANTIPVESRGHAENPDGELAASKDTYPTEWLTDAEHERLSAGVKES